MAITRRDFLLRAAGLAGCALTAWAVRPADALSRAVAFLGSRQSTDGAWRSRQYAAFRSGDALTPLILWAIGTANSDVSARGVRWLEELTDSVPRRAELAYPLFTAGYAAQVFASNGDARRAAVWADVIESLRIREELGWPSDSVACGAWSDSPRPPYLPPGATLPPDMLAPNISATVLALQALRAVGRDGSKAIPFIESCQNFSAGRSGGLDDGGFFFAPGDPVRNKAGVAEADPPARYRSYGSATCDGLLALRACGVADSNPRIRAAIEWLRANSNGAAHGGEWSRARIAARDSLVFYNAQALGATGLDFAQRKLASDLRGMQAADGSWASEAVDSFEDDPLVATAFAARALAYIA